MNSPTKSTYFRKTTPSEPSKKTADKRLAKSRKGNVRRTDKRPEEVEVIKHDPMESLRVYVADTLSGFKAPTINRYED